MSGRTEYPKMTLTSVGPVDGHPVDKTDGHMYRFGDFMHASKNVLSMRPGQVDFLAGNFFSNSLASWARLQADHLINISLTTEKQVMAPEKQNVRAA